MLASHGRPPANLKVMVEERSALAPDDHGLSRVYYDIWQETENS